MKIAIDCRTILNPGFGEGAGVGHYTYYLVSHLLRMDIENEYALFFDPALHPQAIKTLIGNHPRARIHFFPFHRYREYLPGIYSELLTTAAVSQSRPDIFHVPGGRIPLSYRGKTVLTVHDLAIFRHPEWFPPQTLSIKFLYPKSIERATHLIAVSRATARDLEELLAVPSEKITPIYEGIDLAKRTLFDNDVLTEEDVIDPIDLARFYHVHFPYIFFLGTVEPRKNVTGLLRALQRLLQNGSLFHGIQLVIAGAKGWKHEEVFELINEINQQFKKIIKHPPINYIGYVSHRYKWPLLKHAAAFVFPSLYEGFGLPVLEAMSQGTPVVTSRVAALPEIVKDTGILINPSDENEIFTALRKIILDKKLSQDLKIKGLARAAEFSWERTAAQTLEVYKRVAREE